MTLYPSQDTFVRGEISPRLHSRASLDLYRSALARCENFLTLPHGGIRKRGGTRFVAPLKDETRKARLIPFKFSANQAYALEIGHLYTRVYTGGGYVTEFATPWTEAQLDRLQYVQSADVMWVTSPEVAPRKITRLSNASWAIETVIFDDGPFGSVNALETARVYASASVGSVTITATVPTFSPTDVGRLFRMELESYAGIKPWEPNGVIAGSGGDGAINRCRYEGRVYAIQTVLNQSWRFGNTPPTHTKGIEPDGPGTQDDTYGDNVGVDLLYLHSGAGMIILTGYTSPTVVTGTVVRFIPEQLIGPSQTTFLWSFGAFHGAEQPTAVTLFEERLFFANRLSVFGSKTGDFSSFEVGEKDDDALEFLLAANEANEITWLADADGFLAIGTIGGVRSLAGAGVDEALTGSSFKNRSSSTDDCSYLRPVSAGSAFLYVPAGRRGLAEMLVNQSSRFESADVFQISEHLPKAVGGFSDLSFSRRPDPMAFLPGANGELVGFTYQRDQEVRGAHRQRIGGTFGGVPYGFVESVTVTPGQTGDDDVWLIVKRTINGQTRRYIEILTPAFEYDDASMSVCVDSALSYSGDFVSTVTGLDHLEGQTVEGVANGVPVGPFTVLGGSVTLPTSASRVTLGLPYVAEAETLELDAGGRDGSLMGRRKKVSHLYASVMETDISRLMVASKAKQRWEKARSYSLSDDAARGVLQTGTLEPIPVDDSWAGQAKVILRHTGPLPCTLRAIIPAFDSEP